jgi:hypothetical protein
VPLNRPRLSTSAPYLFIIFHLTRRCILFGAETVSFHNLEMSQYFPLYNIYKLFKETLGLPGCGISLSQDPWFRKTTQKLAVLRVGFEPATAMFEPSMFVRFTSQPALYLLIILFVGFSEMKAKRNMFSLKLKLAAKFYIQIYVKLY